jgi:hypothetical protein
MKQLQDYVEQLDAEVQAFQTTLPTDRLVRIPTGSLIIAQYMKKD